MGKENHCGFAHVSPMGCMWTAIHVVKYQRWHNNARKRLSYSRIADDEQNLSNEEVNGQEDGGTMQEQNDGNGVSEANGSKGKHSSPSSKTSVKSRIKAIFTDELNKRKGHHRRRSSISGQGFLKRIGSFHHVSDIDNVICGDAGLNDASPELHETTRPLGSPPPDPLVATSSNKQDREDGCAVGKNQVNDNEKQCSEGYSLLPEKADNKTQKEMLDALDMINNNKEFLLKVLQDPASPWVRHIHSQQAISSKLGSKSMSFSSNSSSFTRDLGSRKLNPKNEIVDSYGRKGQTQINSSTTPPTETKFRQYIRSRSLPSSVATEYRRDGVLILNQPLSQVAYSSASGSAYETKHYGQNSIVIKRFKDLAHKLKHVIKENKEEKHRIIRDAVLDKIPHGRNSSKGISKWFTDHSKNHSFKSDGRESPRNSVESDTYLPSNSKSESPCISRTTSLSASLDRYSQLYKSNCKRESMKITNESLKLQPEDPFFPMMYNSRTLERLLSLPGNRSDLYFNEESLGQNTAIEDGFGSMDDEIDRLTQFSEVGQVKTDSSNNLDSSSIPTPASNTKSDAKRGILDHKLNKMERAHKPSYEKEASLPAREPNATSPEFSFQKEIIKPEGKSSSNDLKPAPVDGFPGKLNLTKDKLPESSMETVGTIEQANIDRSVAQLLVDDKDKAQFDYVKEILELSGFSNSEVLGAWQAADQPLDPTMLEELESCLLMDPYLDECDNCYRMLLFDLINQVLMEIYARSYTYYPKPLSSLSHIRPMPTGQVVLEEVWTNIKWYLSYNPGVRHLLDYIASRDLSKSDGWMNLQFDTECIGIELEDLIFEDLLQEAICSG